MKQLFLMTLITLSVNSMAIEFISEAQVGEKLEAQKVIEVSKYAIESLIKDSSNCSRAFSSRSARAYIVKKQNQAFLYLTESGLKDLELCVEM